MRVALVSDTYTPQVNGVSSVVLRTARALEAAGHTAAVVAPRYPGYTAATPGELRIRSAPFPPYPAIRLSVPIPGRVARFLDASRAQLVHVATEGPLGLAGRAYALRRGLPLVTSFHTDFPGYCRHYGAAVLEPAAWRWLRWFHRPAHLTHTPGAFVRDQLTARGFQHAVVWGRGVDIEHFHPTRNRARWRFRLGVREGEVLVLHVGRLAPEKNIDILCAACTTARAALGSRARFVVAGEGPMARLVDQQMPWATRIGFVDREALADLYVAADLCILPSATETCGLVALEAMASALAVVAADAGGFRESIVHGATGVLAPANDAQAFAAHLIRLALDPAQRQALARAARCFALTRSAQAENVVLLRQYRSLVDAAQHAAEAGCAA